MAKYAAIPIEDLVSDVAVDPVHVRELADSIMSKGQLAPVIVREETREVIDGFHRIAAMKELGFSEVECVLIPCDDEGFWDFRIIQASLHKNVTFARAIDWIDKVFQLSPWRERYKSAFSLFTSVKGSTAPKEVTDWALAKAKVWGLAPATVRDWLYTKDSLAPSLLEEVKRGSTTAPTNTYMEVARNLPSRPELHGPIIEKTTKEDLSSKEVRTVAQAINRAEDEEEVRMILSQPVARTAEDLTRAAKVEKLLREPTVEPPVEEKQRALAGRLLEVYMDLQQQVHVIRQLRERERERLDVLNPGERQQLLEVVRDLKGELQWLEDSLGGTIEGQAIVEGKMIEGR